MPEMHVLSIVSVENDFVGNHGKGLDLTQGKRSSV